MTEKLVCEKCGRLRPETDFFKMKTGQRYNMCKDCLCQYIDNTKPDTFLWILEAFDVPYIEKKWIQQTNEIYKKKGKLTPKSVIGTYMRTMNMTQYKDYHYADSDKLNFADKKAKQEAEAAQQRQLDNEEVLRQRLESGEITQAEYDTLSVTTVPAAMAAQNHDFLVPKAPDNTALLEQLTDEDYQYLNLKWGSVYRPDQWVTMETMYNKYANEYDLNADREEVLKKMCKTSLKMDESLDAGDVTGYKNLAGVFDQLRKSGKFTEAQNKEERTKYLDTIGELVALAEKAKGPIKNDLPDPDDYPQDKIDFTIKDLKAYTYSLVAGEPHMQDLIESFITKYERAEQADVDFGKELITSVEEEEKDAVTQDEAVEYQKFLEEEIAADAEALLAEFGDADES